MSVLVANRLADVAISSAMPEDPALALVTEPIFKYRLVVVTAGQPRLRGGPRQWLWYVDPAGTDPDSETGQMLTSLGIAEDQVRVFPNQTAAWAAAADGTASRPRWSTSSPSGCAAASCPASTCLAPNGRLLARHRAGTAAPDSAVSSFRRYLGTPEAMHLSARRVAVFRPPGSGRRSTSRSGA